MKKLTILVDMDDTIEELLPAWIKYLNEFYGTGVQISDVTDWDVSAAFPSLTREQVYAPLYRDEFWDLVKPMCRSREVLQRLIADGHHVLVITTSNYQTIRAKMERVLFRYFPFFTWDDVIVTARKQLVKGDVLIDDGVHNLVGGDYAKLLMSQPHNMRYDAAGSGMVRVDSWDDIYRVIRAIANN